MAFTMHSHSGQFCPGHAVDQLEAIIQHAISVGFKTMALTEHMPRYDEQDLYPEELDDPKASLAVLPIRHEAYLTEAQRLREKYASEIHILIAFEAEFIRPVFESHVLELASAPSVDFFIGSVHHVHSIPIDFDKATYEKALAASEGSEEKLFKDYYDLQHQMLLALKPKVVGHFDLIRLPSHEPDRDIRAWKPVWSKILRNLQLIKQQGGLLECNTAALRKGLAEPYPGKAIAEEWLKMEGRFTMSDDSHGIAQVATNYGRALGFLEGLGVEEVWTFKKGEGDLEDVSVSLKVFREAFP